MELTNSVLVLSPTNRIHVLKLIDNSNDGSSLPPSEARRSSSSIISDINRGITYLRPENLL